MNPPEVSICIATLRNHSLHLTKLLLSIERNTTVPYEVIIVSGGGTVRGYTAPMNQALRAAVSPLVACLNDDVEVSEGWLEPLLERARAGAWAVTPDMTHTDGPQVYAPYCLLLRREALEQVGDLDEQFILWCFTAQTLISTPAGLRPIAELSVGDAVCSATGASVSVLATHSRQADDVLRLIAHGLDGSEVTAEHPYWARRRLHRPSQRYHREFSEPEWIVAGELHAGDLIAYPTFIRSSSALEVTPEEAYIAGRWLADGWAVHGKRSPCWLCGQDKGGGANRYCEECRHSGRVAAHQQERARIAWTRHNRKARGSDEVPPSAPSLQRERVRSAVPTDYHICGAWTERDAILQALEKAGLPYCEHGHETDVEFRLGILEARRILAGCGSNAWDKQLPYWAWGAPVEVREALLRGYLDGDGNKYTVTRQRSTPAKHERASSVNRQLIHGMAQLARSLGRIPKLYEAANNRTPSEIRGRVIRQPRRVYEMHLASNDGDGSGHRYLREDGLIWAPVRSIESVPPATVYNLTVDGDNTFVADGVVVHNCSDIDYAQRLIDAGHRPVKVLLPNPIIHHVSATSEANPDLDLNAIQQADLERYRQKHGEDANAAKGRMALE